MNDQIFDTWPTAEINESDQGNQRPWSPRRVAETAFPPKRKEEI
jgi:hypothetical protein